MPIDLYQAGPGGSSSGIDLYNEAGMAPSPPGQSLQAYHPGNDPGWFHDFLHQLPLADKAVALGQASGILDGGVKAPTFGERYQKSLTNYRNDIADYEQQNPNAAFAAKAAGVVAPMLIPEAKIAQALGRGAETAGAVPSVGKAIGRSAKTGALYGGAYGLSGTDDTSLKEDAEAAALGAATGAAGGAALSGGVSLAGVPFRAAAEAHRSLMPEQSPNIAGRILNQAAGGRIPNFEQAPLPGMKLSPGQASNDPGLLWLERTIKQGSPEGAAVATQNRTANNQAITQAIHGMGDVHADSAAAMSDALEQAQIAAQAKTRAAWKAAGIDEATAIPTKPLKDGLTEYLGTLTKRDQTKLPSDLVADIQGLPTQEKLGEIQSIRADIGDLWREANRSGKSNLARILGGLKTRIDDFADNPPDAGAGSSLNVDQGQLQRYQDARAATREMKQTFTQPGNVRNVLGVDRYGSDKVPISKTADQFLKPYKSGGPEALGSYLKAISTKDANGAVSLNPDGAKAARDAFTGKFLNYVQQNALDEAGTPLISPAKTTNFLDDYRHVVNSKLFTDQQRGMFRSIEKATQMVAREGARAPGGGSDTFQKLAGDKFLDALISPGAAKLLRAGGGLTGAAIGSLTEGPIATVAGLIGGSKGTDALLSKLYQAPRDRVVNLLTEAANDQDIAKALMMKASPANAKLIKPATRTKILGILGAQPAAPVAGLLTTQ